VYLPADQQPDNQSLNYLPKDLIVRVDSNRTDALPLANLAATVRQIIRSADPQQPIADIRPLSAIVEGQTADRSVQVRVLGGFAVLSCLLAAVGLHGLLAFLVSMRRREFGVRIALGASPHQVLGLVARRALALGLAGIGIGVVLAYAAGRSLEALLVGVSPGDPVTLAVAIGIALAVTLAGTLMPALRASRTNPRDALQETAG
jgi:ABC-type antimicrobial peptide transport system permease subunit